MIVICVILSIGRLWASILREEKHCQLFEWSLPFEAVLVTLDVKGTFMKGLLFGLYGRRRFINVYILFIISINNSISIYGIVRSGCVAFLYSTVWFIKLIRS
jgi:hypothetical protein